MPGIDVAVTEAARLDQIGFPEFTSKLITDVFDALIAANLRQTESYVELLGAVGTSLTDYINDTKDDIDGAQILQFLAAVLPAATNSDGGSKVALDSTLTPEDAKTINDAVAVPGEESTAVAKQGKLDRAQLDTILEAAARRLAANKYDLLQEMVRQGVLRLVVEGGEIETRLTFQTHASTFVADRSSSYTRDVTQHRAQAKTAGFLAKWVNISGSTAFNSVSVRTASAESSSSASSDVEIFGGVKIRFKTDYLALS